MTKADLASALGEMGYKKGQVKEVIDDIFGIIKNKILSGESVSIKGFGTFEVRERKGRLGTDPITHERIMRPGYRAVVFIPGVTLREAAKGNDLPLAAEA